MSKEDFWRSVLMLAYDVCIEPQREKQVTMVNSFLTRVRNEGPPQALDFRSQAVLHLLDDLANTIPF